MAQVDSSNNPNDPNNPNNTPGGVNQPGAAGTNQPATTGGGAGPVTATGAGNVTGQVVGTATPSQPFQNISSYLTANAPQSEALAGQVAQTVSNPINQANQDIANTSNAFTKSVNTGYVPENTQLLSDVAKDPRGVVARGPQSVKDFLSNFNDTYTGPSSFTTQPNFGNIESEIANANSLATNTQTQPGIQTLLRQTEGPTSTQGINNLDALLLNLNPANLGTIQKAAAPAAALTPALASATSAGNAQVAAAQAAANKIKQNARGSLDTASGNLTTALNNEVASANTAQDKAIADYNKYFSGALNTGKSLINEIETNPQLTGINLGSQPFTPTVWNNLKLGPSPQQPTIPRLPINTEQVANAGDFATAAALSQLSGGAPLNLPISPTGTPQAYPQLQIPNSQAAFQSWLSPLETYLRDALAGTGPARQPGPLETTPNISPLNQQIIHDYLDRLGIAMNMNPTTNVTNPNQPPITYKPR